jgi:hypothetical protein
VLHDWRIDDDAALEQLGRLEQPIAAARPNGFPPEHVGFRVSRDLLGMSYISRSRRGSSGDMSCVLRSLLEPQGPRAEIPLVSADLKVSYTLHRAI